MDPELIKLLGRKVNDSLPFARPSTDAEVSLFTRSIPVACWGLRPVGDLFARICKAEALGTCASQRSIDERCLL
jgi:hypothetical protein